MKTFYSNVSFLEHQQLKNPFTASFTTIQQQSNSSKNPNVDISLDIIYKLCSWKAGGLDVYNFSLPHSTPNAGKEISWTLYKENCNPRVVGTIHSWPLAVFLVVITFWWVQLLKFLHQRHILPSALLICVCDTAVGRLGGWHRQGLHTDDPDNM